ncbi:capsid protein [Enterococcus sp. AZ103]|uniref:capsid protein n=1 Tax=Enterococcus sp. AZ103 TaxID=2774628 RepID=UPI003F2824F2
MGFMDNIKNRVKNWLNIQDGQPSIITISELLNFPQNVAKNRIWYRGDSYELEQLYKQIGNRSVGLTFWGARSTPGMEIRKIHTGIPGLIVDRLVEITLADYNEPEFDDPDHQEIWENIVKETNFENQLERALKEVLYVGDGAFKISFDPKVSEYPIIEWVPGDRVDFVYQRGKVREIIFKTFFTEGQKNFTLLEHYGYGYITNELYHDGNIKNLDATRFTESLEDFKFDDEIILGVSLTIYESSKWEGRGQSIFDRKIDSFDALDESWSQWIDALRAGRTKQYIPEVFLPRDPNTGMVMAPNSFDNRFIKTDNDARENAVNKIDIQQAAIPHDSYLATYVTALDLALQGVISPSTLGIDVKKLDNAEAQREKEKATLYTRAAIITAMENFIPHLIYMTINSFNVMQKKPIVDVDVSIPFGEYANPSFESQVETVGKGKTQGIMSIEAVVEELYGDSKDDEWKAEEVARLKNEQGIAEFDDEPSLNTSLGDFSIQTDDPKGDEKNDSDDPKQNIPNEPEGSTGAS